MNNNIDRQARSGAAGINYRISKALASAVTGRKRVNIRRSVRVHSGQPITVAGGTSNLDIVCHRGVDIVGVGTLAQIGDTVDETTAVGHQVSSAPSSGASQFTIASGTLVTGKYYWVFDTDFIETHALTSDTRMCQGQLVKSVTISNANKTTTVLHTFRQDIVKSDIATLRALDVTARACVSVAWSGGQFKSASFGSGSVAMHLNLSYSSSISKVKSKGCYSHTILARRSFGASISDILTRVGRHTSGSSESPGGYGVELSNCCGCTVSNIRSVLSRYALSLSQGSAGNTITGVAGKSVGNNAIFDFHGGYCQYNTISKIITSDADIRIGNSSWRFGTSFNVLSDCTVKNLVIMGKSDNDTFQRIAGSMLRVTMLADDDPLELRPVLGINNCVVTDSTFTCANLENDRPLFFDDAVLLDASTVDGITFMQISDCTFKSTGSVYQAAYFGMLPASTSSVVNIENCTLEAGPSGHAIAHNVDAVNVSGDLALTLIGTNFKVSAADRKVYFTNTGATYAQPSSQIQMETCTVQVGAAAPVAVDSSWVNRGTGIEDMPELMFL